jgi:hypothetical protein
MATYSQTPGLLNIRGVVGTDFSCELEITKDVTGYQFEAGIVLQEYPAKRIHPITITVTNAAQGEVTLSLTDQETSDIGKISGKKWYLNWIIGTTKQTILAGTFELSDIPIGKNIVMPTEVTIQTQDVDVILSAFSNAALDSKQPINAALTQISGLSPNENDFLQRKSGAWTNRTPAQVLQDLPVGTMATQNANNVAITGGSITGITDLALADGGTNNSLVAQAGGVVYSTADRLAISSVGTAGQALVSGGTNAPVWEDLRQRIFNDNTTNRQYFPVFAYQAAGTATTLYGSSQKLKFNPSNGYLTATGFDTEDIGIYQNAIHWGGNQVLNLEEQRIYNSDGNEVARWGPDGMFVEGGARKDLPLRLIDIDASNNSNGAYIIVRPSASATTNGTELRNAYAAAKAFTPNTSALSATNRATVMLLPGRYDLGTIPLAMDTEFVDLVGISSDPKHVVITSSVTASASGTIVQTADNVIFRNVTIDRTSTPSGSGASRTAAYFPNRPATTIQNWASNGTTATVESNGHGLVAGDSIRITSSGDTSFDGAYNNVSIVDGNTFTFACTVNSSGVAGAVQERFDDTYIENCIFSGSNDSGMRTAIEYAGTYRRCVAGASAFAGTFQGAGSSSSIASGLFEDCIAGSNSFGSGTASGTFNRCTSTGIFSFGTIASGIFTDCSTVSGFDTPSGTFTRCSVSTSGFGSGNGQSATGSFTDCTAAFTINGYLGLFTGTMRRCRFRTTASNANALRVGAGAKIFDSTLIATGTGNSITAGSAVTISLAGCRMNRDINANVSNNLGTLTESYNLIDSDID